MEAATPPSTVEVLSDALIDTVRNPLGRAGNTWPRTRLTEDAMVNAAAAIVGTLRIGETLRTPRINCSASPDPTGGGRGQGDLAEVKRIKTEIRRHRQRRDPGRHHQRVPGVPPGREPMLPEHACTHHGPVSTRRRGSLGGRR